MTFRHVVSDPFGSFVEIVEDPALAERLRRDEPVRFRVLADEWDADHSTRMIRSAEIVEAR